MKRVVATKYILHKFLFDLEKAVNRLIDEGWTPVGGVQAVYNEGNLAYVQTMVKEV